ncbi:MAG: lycopene beta-cyclase CrtY [Marinomonas sp.]
MTDKSVDVAIVGGGLAGGLIALALHRMDPTLQLALIEQGETLGGNHRWSWFGSDLDAAGTALMDCFEQARWDAGYDVRFAEHSRILTSGYRSLASSDFHDALMDALPAEAVHLSASAASLDAAGVTLDDGTRIAARNVIDCRPFEPSKHLEGGWQVFLGQHMRLDTPHGLDRPTIMDADVDQLAPHGNGGAYRFLYTLPLGAQDVFVEDTYYADEPKLDRDVLASRIGAYCGAKGWHGETVAEETGILPVITGGDFAAYQACVAIPGVAIAGARGGFSHPLTSYTVPIAVENALAIANAVSAGSANLTHLVEARAKAHWRAAGFYRILGRMLFGAAEPHERDRIFAQFYRRPQPLVERFYRGHSTWADRISILTGRPPVSIASAIKALTTRGKPLITENTA